LLKHRQTDGAFYVSSSHKFNYFNAMKEEYKVKGEDLLSKVKQIINEGNVSRIIIKDTKGDVFLEIPVTIGIIGAVFAPVLAAVGALAALVANFTIEVVRRD
jgi:phage-related minor tail protein